MASVSEIVARLTLNAKEFTSRFEGAIDQATTRARAGGAQIGRAFSETAGDGLREFAGQVPVVGSALTGLNGAALLAAGGIGAATLALGFALSNTEEYARASRGLDAVLKATGNQTGFTADQLRAFAEEQESALAISAESILEAQKVLATYDGVAGTTFKRSIELAADLAATFGGDLSSNSEKLGNVLQNLAAGNVEGLSKGFKFLGTAALGTIAALAKTGDTAAAQTALLDALEEKIGGTGGAAGQGVAGAFFRLADSVGDLSRNFAEQSGLYGAVVSGLDGAAAAAGKYADRLTSLNGLQLTGQAFKLAQFAFNPAAAIGAMVGNAIGGGGSGMTADQKATRDGILAQQARREQGDADRAADQAAKRATDAAKAEGDKARAAADAVESAKQAATEQERVAKAAEAAAKAVERQRDALSASVADLEFGAKMAGLTRDEAEKLTAIRSRELQFGKLLSANDRERIARAIDLRQINAEGRAADDESLGQLMNANDGFLDDLSKRATAWIDVAATAQGELVKRQREDFKYLSDSFYDIFSGRSGNIWNKFKELGARTLAELAAQFVLTGNLNLDGTSGGGLVGSIVSALGGSKGGGGGLLSAGLSSLGLAGGIGGLVGSAGLGAVTISSAAATAAGVGALGGTTLAGAGAGASGILGSLGGAGAALGAAAPYLALAAGLAVLATQVFKKDPFSDVGLVTAIDGVKQSSIRTRGTGSAEKADTLTDAVSATLASLAQTLGTSVKAGIAGGSIGTNKDSFYYNPTGGDFKAAGKVSYATAEDAALAAVRDLVSKGALSGIDSSIAKLLSTGDLTTQTAKAQLLASALKEFSSTGDPTIAAVTALNEQFAQLRDVMAEAGSSAADVAKASALYDTKLQAIRDSTGAATSTLKSFLEDLGFGSSSPLALGDQVAAARAAYGTASAGIGSAGFDQGAFVAAGQRLLDIEGQINGRTQDFFAVFNQVQADTNRAIGAINNATTINTENPFAKKTADATAATADNTAALLGAFDGLSERIAALLAANGSGGFIGGDSRGFVNAA